MNPENIVKPKVSPLTKTGSKEPNDWGLYNMFDNVSEFTLGIFKSGVGTRLSVTSIKGDTIGMTGQYFINQLDSIRKQSEYVNIMGDNYKDNFCDSLYYKEFNDKFDNVGFRYVRTFLGKKDQ
jgi:formylglycine-generating enzyme required for sulfatase activity